MLSLKLLRENPAVVKAALTHRGEDASVVDNILELDHRRRELLGEAESLKQVRNQFSQHIAELKRKGSSAEKEIAEMHSVNQRIKELDPQLAQVQQAQDQLMLGVPNIPHESVPFGADETSNSLIKTWGQIPVISFEAKAHWDLGSAQELLDFEAAGKITGSRFCFYRGLAARLERAIINFMLDTHGRNGYEEVIPPYIVNSTSMRSTGQLPKFADDSFSLNFKDYFLVPTAEVPLTNYFRDQTLSETDLPINFTAYSPCFRSEAGASGRDTRGLIRNHQFNKVELVKFTTPENSYSELEELLKDAERILQLLELPYRVVTLCSGDLGFSSAKTYDIEVWFPAQNCYREISSVSNFLDFQARRANIRYRPEAGGKTRFVHTLNGSGLAVGRTTAAIMENFQQADGSIIVPKVLKAYLGY